MNSAVLTILLVVSSLWAWFCVFWLVPHNLRELFKMRLRRLHDELVDDVEAGAFDELSEPLNTAETMKCFIDMADALTPARISLLMIAGHPNRAVDPDAHRPLRLKGLSYDDKGLLFSYIRRFNDTVTKHVFFGSPSGWFLCVPLAPFYIYAKATGLRERREAPIAFRFRRRTAEASLTAITATHGAGSDHHVGSFAGWSF